VVYYSPGGRLGAPRAPSIYRADRQFRRHLAGYVAKRMGLPIRTLRIAANVNDILARRSRPASTRCAGFTPPLALDGHPDSSNFERLLFEASAATPTACAG
jgi:threonine synthase